MLEHRAPGNGIRSVVEGSSLFLRIGRDFIKIQSSRLSSRLLPRFTVLAIPIFGLAHEHIRWLLPATDAPMPQTWSDCTWTVIKWRDNKKRWKGLTYALRKDVSINFCKGQTKFFISRDCEMKRSEILTSMLQMKNRNLIIERKLV